MRRSPQALKPSTLNPEPCNVLMAEAFDLFRKFFCYNYYYYDYDL